MLQSIIPDNFITAADGYKACHWSQMQPLPAYVQSSIVPRKGEEIVVAGNRLLAAYLASVRITREMIEEAAIEIAEQGYEFNREGWEYILNNLDGRLPLRMNAIMDGTVVPANTAITIFQNTVPFVCSYLPSYVETIGQCIVQKMTTVATQCRKLKKKVISVTERTGGTPALVDYKIHNFGDRSADAPEAALLAAVAHAMLFSGSDCLGANRVIKKLYNTKKAYTTSVDAWEHSTMCMKSDAVNKDDFDAAVATVQRLEEVVARTKRGIGIPLMSAPIDTYDSKRFVRDYIGTDLKDRIIASGGVYVSRPDSGHYLEEPFDIIRILFDKVGTRKVNDEGFLLMHDSFRVIQGDGINFETSPVILDKLIEELMCIDNLTLGMGSGLTHGEGRDKYSFSQKTTAYTRDGNDPFNFKNTWVGVKKDPITDPGKASLTGYLLTVENVVDGAIKTLQIGEIPTHGGINRCISVLQFLDGTDILASEPELFDGVRERANKGLVY